jgi:hypothetical protein
VTDERDQRAAAVDALRQALRHAGHVMYGAASDVGRDQTSDTVTRAVAQVAQATQAVTDQIIRLNDIERESERSSDQ